MGLDVTAYRKAVWLHPYQQTCDHDADATSVLHEPHFVARADGLPEGCYRSEGEFHFRAGSYSGHNAWRDQLALMALGVRPEEVWRNTEEGGRQEEFIGKPFYELIDFSDCNGIIGPVTSAKLLADFKAHHKRAERWARQRSRDGEWFIQLYAQWAKAFYLASDGGFVSFH